MKKLLAILLSVAMLFAILTFCTANPPQSGHPSDFSEPAYTSSETILCYTSSEAKMLKDGAILNQAVKNGKIIVVKTDTNTGLHESGAGELLGMSLSPANNDLSPLSTKSMDRGVDVAAIYYEYKENVLGTYIINIGSGDTVNVDILIDEAIAEIKARQNSPTLSALSTTDVPDGTQLLNVFTFFSVRTPKGSSAQPMSSLLLPVMPDAIILSSKQHLTPVPAIFYLTPTATIKGNISAKHLSQRSERGKVPYGSKTMALKETSKQAAQAIPSI